MATNHVRFRVWQMRCFVMQVFLSLSITHSTHIQMHIHHSAACYSNWVRSDSPRFRNPLNLAQVTGPGTPSPHHHHHHHHHPPTPIKHTHTHTWHTHTNTGDLGVISSKLALQLRGMANQCMCCSHFRSRTCMEYKKAMIHGTEVLFVDCVPSPDPWPLQEIHSYIHIQRCFSTPPIYRSLLS